MQALKIGRNDPCPCGSGKKYKKCCGILAEYVEPSVDLFTRYSSLMTAVKIKLDQFYGHDIKRVRRELMQHFLRFTVDKNLAPEHETIFSDWLWFDQTDDQEDTLGYQYLKSHGEFMEPPLRDCLGAMSLSYLSVYEVLKANDLYLELRDIFLDRKCEVLLKEPWEEADDKPEALILGRVVQFADANLFSGMVLLIENDAGQKDFLVEHINHALEIQNDKMINLLKFNGEIPFGLFNHALKKTFINLNHIAATPINPAERTMLSQNLDSSTAYVLWHESAGWKWFKPDHNDRGYIRLVLADEYLIMCAEVLEDIQSLQSYIGSLLPAHGFTVLNDTFMSQAPPADLMGLWFTVIKDRETEKWLATPHRELEGKTPAETLKEPEGKERLEKMLAQMEDKIQNEEARELISYMRMRIA